MGNVLAQPQKLQTPAELIGDLPNVVLRDTLGGGRFQKTLLCVHDEGGLVVVKVYQKRADTPSLEPFRVQLLRIRSLLTGLPFCHVWPWQAWVETPSAAYLIRQHVACSLYDRLSTRPFLSHIEKRWIAFQLLQALAQAHEAGVCHGDLKAENVLLTSWHWLFLSDWAPYKPTLLPEDNPADFSFYFDTGGRRRCYIAPERFYTTAASQQQLPAQSSGPGGPVSAVASQQAQQQAGPGPASGAAGSLQATGSTASPIQQLMSDPMPRSVPATDSTSTRPVASLTPEMDVFSAGCVLAELFLDGRALFDLGTLLGYKRSEWDLSTHAPLQALDPELRRLILHMTQLDPSARWTARQYLTEWQPPLFPQYFAEVLHPFFNSILSADVDARVALTDGALPVIQDIICSSQEGYGLMAAPQASAGGADDGGAGGDGAGPQTHAGAAGPMQTGQQTGAGGDASTAGAGEETQACVPAVRSSASDGMVLIGVLLCTLIRGVRLVESKRRAIQMLVSTALLCDEDVRLQCVVPYLVTLLADTSASVRCLVLNSLVHIISTIKVIPPSDAKVFQDYLLPAMSLLPNDHEESVRVEYAAGIARLAGTAHRHMMRMHHNSNTAALAAAAATIGGHGFSPRPHYLVERDSSQSSTPSKPTDTQSTPPRAQPAAEEAGQAGAGPNTGASTPPPPPAPAATASNTDADVEVHQGTPGRTDDDVSSGGAAPAESAAALAAAMATAAAEGMAEDAGIRAEAELAQLRSQVEKVVLELVTGVRSTAAVKRSLLNNAGPLAGFYGRRELNNTLLPLIITCLNAQDWQLRSAFFQAAATIGPHTGRESLDVFLLPCLEQALSDGEVSVVCDAVRCVTSVTLQLRKRSLLQAAKKVTSLTVHPSPAVRCAAVAFVAAAARCLPTADVVAQLSPLFTPGQLLNPQTLRDEALLGAELEHLLAGYSSSDDEEDGAGSDSEGQAMHTTLKAALPTPGALGQTSLRVGGPLTAIDEQGAGDAADAADGGWKGSGGRRAGAVSASHRGKSAPAKRHHPLSHSSRAAGHSWSRARSLLAFLGPSSGLDGSGASGAGPGAGAAVDRLAHSLGPGARSMGGSGTLVGLGMTSLAGNQQALPEVEITTQGMLLRPHAPVYLVELPNTPSTILQAAAQVEAQQAAGVSGASPAKASGKQSVALSGREGDGGGGSLLEEAVALLQPTASLHSAAIASIQPRVATLDAWVVAATEKLTRENTAVEAAEKQQLDRAIHLLNRLKGPPSADVRSTATLNTFKLSQLACRVAPGPSLGATRGTATGRLPASPPSYSPSASPQDVPDLAGSVSESVSAAISTKMGVQGPAATSLAASLTQLTLSSLRNSLDSSSLAFGQGGSEPTLGTAGLRDTGPAPDAWRPRGVLVAHMLEHRRAITRVAVAKGGTFAVTTSADETAKVWDMRRLERDVSFHSRLTYAAQPGALTSCAAVDDDYSVATGSAAGTVHVWRVEVASGVVAGRQVQADRYAGVIGRRQISPHHGAVQEVCTWGPHTLMYVTQRGGIHAWDLRVKQDVWRLPATPSQGLLEHLALEPVGPGGGAGCWGATGHWLVSGSSRGWLTTWDVRFMMPAHSWQHPVRCAIDAIALASAPPHRLGVDLDHGADAGPHGSSSSGPLLYVAAGHQEVALWDVASSRVTQVLRCLGPRELGAGDGSGAAPLLPGCLQPSITTSTAWLHEPQQPAVDLLGPHGSAGDGLAGGGGGGGGADGGGPDGSVDVLGVARLAQPVPRSPGVRTLLPLTSGLLLTGSSDRCIRCWDGCKLDNSHVVVGPLWCSSDTLGDTSSRPPGLAVPQYRYSYHKHSMQSVPVVEERCMLDTVTKFNETSYDLRQLLHTHDQCHSDALTHMTTAEGIQGSRLLLSASRDGCLKAWK